MSKAIMEEVAAYLRQHADEELSLTDLAQHFHYSPSHLYESVDDCILDFLGDDGLRHLWFNLQIFHDFFHRNQLNLGLFQMKYF